MGKADNTCSRYTDKGPVPLSISVWVLATLWLCGGSIPYLGAAPSDIQKQLKKDLKTLETSVGDKENGKIWLRVAEAYQQTAQQENAKKAFKQAEEHLPVVSTERARALEALGDILVEQGKSLEAFAMYHQSIAVSPASSVFLLQKLAELSDPLLENKESQRYLQVYNRLFPNQGQSAQQQLDAEDENIPVELQLKQVEPNAQSLWLSLQATQKVAKKNWGEIQELAQKLLEIDPHFRKTEVLLARARAITNLIGMKVGSPLSKEVPLNNAYLEAFIAYDLAIKASREKDGVGFEASVELAGLLVDGGCPELAVARLKNLREVYADRSLEILPRLASALKDAKEFRDAKSVCEEIIALVPGSVFEVRALEIAGECLVSMGNPTDAWAYWQRAAEVAPLALDGELSKQAAKTSKAKLQLQWQRNRVMLDQTIPTVLAKAERFIGLLPPNEQRNAHGFVLQNVVLAYPENPESRRRALFVADSLSKEGKHAEALSFYLHVLDNGGDRTYSKGVSPKMPPNKHYFDGISIPLEEDFVRKALIGFSECCRSLGFEVPVQWSERVIGKWADAIRQTYVRHGNWRTLWRQLLEELKTSPHSALARVHLAQCLRRSGQFAESMRHLNVVIAHDENQISYIKERARMELALLFSESLGLYRSAEIQLKNLLRSKDPFIYPRARFCLAQCKEFQGRLNDAYSNYEWLAEKSINSDLRVRSSLSLQRIEKAREKYRLEIEPDILRYIGEDRQSQGDWKNRNGVDAYILCATACPGNTIGGNLWPIKYQDGYGDQDTLTGSCHWSTGVYTYEKSALFDPIKSVHTFSNWDDGGEKRSVGEGPGLCWDIEIPPGSFRLSLYFVNDYNYYEPNRKWTLYVTDASTRRYLSGCSVEHFVNGVYKQFAVNGGRKLRFHLWRDGSLNALLAGVFLDKIELPKLNEQNLFHVDSTNIVAARPSAKYRSIERAYDKMERLISQMSKRSVEKLLVCHDIQEQVAQYLSEARIPDVLATGFGGRMPGALATRPTAPELGKALWIDWQIGWLLRNEPSRARSMAQEFFEWYARSFGRDKAVGRLAESENQSLASHNFPAARTYTLGRLRILRGERPLFLDDFKNQALDVFMQSIRYPRGVSSIIGANGKIEQRAVFGDYPRDFGFARRLVYDQLVHYKDLYPDAPPDDVYHFVNFLSSHSFDGPWGRLFGEVTTDVLELWKDHRFHFALLARYAEAGFASERRRRWNTILKLHEKEAPDPSQAWLRYLKACRKDRDLAGAIRAERIILDRFEDPVLHMEAMLEIVELYCAKANWRQAKQRVEGLLKKYPEAAQNVRVRASQQAVTRGIYGVSIPEIVVEPSEIPADGKSTARCAATVWRTIDGKLYKWRTTHPPENIPAARQLVWSIQSDSLGARIDPATGVVSAGNRQGYIWINVADSAQPDISSSCRLRIGKP